MIFFKKIFLILFVIQIWITPGHASFSCKRALSEAVSQIQNVKNNVQSLFKLKSPEVSEELVQTIRRADDQAFEILNQSQLSNKEINTHLSVWLTRVEKRLQNSEYKNGVLEYTVLLHLLRTDFLDKSIVPEFHQRIEDLVVNSWVRLTGKNKPLSEIIESRLPRRVLRNATPRIRQYHASVFRKADEFLSFKGLAPKDFYLSYGSGFTAMGLVAFGFTQTGGEVLAGAVMGGLVGTAAELLIHKYISHPMRSFQKKFKKGSWFGHKIKKNIFSHTVMHHGRYSHKDYSSPRMTDTQARQRIEKAGIVDSKTMENRDLGMKIDVKSTLQMFSVAMPTAAALSLATDLSAIGIVTAAFTSGTFVPHINFNHKYFHMTRTELLERPNNWLKKIYFNSQYFAYIARSHYVHHRDQDSNFTVYPGLMDAAFKTLKNPTIDDIWKMDRDDQVFYGGE